MQKLANYGKEKNKSTREKSTSKKEGPKTEKEH
ncbi:hypothetical protein BACCAC_00718 [Bacteroides caccae ATCC 43185]|nr:hypothetical protein BACCAC_00718 [Bacteroides caccae ATCC 43185]